MGMRLVHLVAWGLTVLVLSTPGLVNANTIIYGDLDGVTTDFLGVQETANSPGHTAPLFGAPTLVGNALFFNHMSFVSQSNNGASDINDGQLDTTIVTTNLPGYYINQLTLQEFGDSTLAGTGTSATYASVGSAITLTVLALDDNEIPFALIGTNLTFTNNGQWTLAGGPLTAQNWSGSINFQMAPFLESFGITGQATEVALTLDNTLATSSEANTEAFIAKKAEGLQVTPIVVPEPSTLSLLMLTGALLMVGRFGRKS
jgi:hypothetical protein